MRRKEACFSFSEREIGKERQGKIDKGNEESLEVPGSKSALPKGQKEPKRRGGGKETWTTP